MKNRFGRHIREVREKRKGISLTEAAQTVGISLTYLSKIERGELDPPSEEVITKLALLLGEDPDVLLLLAGRIPSDIVDTINAQPEAFVQLIRSLRGQPREEIVRVARAVRDGKW